MTFYELLVVLFTCYMYSDNSMRVLYLLNIVANIH